MKLRKIKALMYSDWLVTKGNKGRAVESFFFPISTVIVYGLFSLFIKDKSLEAGLIILIANVLWNFAYLMQGHINMMMNEDMWSGSFKQIMMSGVSGSEFIVARILSSLIISLSIMAIMILLSVFVFEAGLLITQWFAFSLITFSILLSSIALAIFVGAGVIALGHEYGFIAWTAMQVFVMLSAPFYPISIYPTVLQPIVAVMPFTWQFEAARNMIAGVSDFNAIVNSLIICFIYLVASIPFYLYIFKKAKQKGWLVRLG